MTKHNPAILLQEFLLEYVAKSSQHLHFSTSKPQLVGGFNPSEKYHIVNWDDYFQYMET